MNFHYVSHPSTHHITLTHEIEMKMKISPITQISFYHSQAAENGKLKGRKNHSKSKYIHGAQEKGAHERGKTLEMYLLSHKDYVRLNLSAHFSSHFFRSNVTKHSLHTRRCDADGSIRYIEDEYEKHIQFYF